MSSAIRPFPYPTTGPRAARSLPWIPAVYLGSPAADFGTLAADHYRSHLTGIDRAASMRRNRQMVKVVAWVAIISMVLTLIAAAATLLT